MFLPSHPAPVPRLHPALPAALVAALLLATPAAGQSPADRLRGRVTNDSGQAVSGATVIITRGPDRAHKETTTDSTGRWQLTFENGTGDYLVAVRALGFGSARRRVQEDGPGPHTFTADFTLARDANMLAAVKVTADKPERARAPASPFDPETGASERWVDGVSGQLPPGSAGDLGAVAANNPGLTVGPNGAGVLGTDPSSNLTTLGGMALPGGTVPRAANAQTRVTATTYDPTRGGFSGANVDLQLERGSREFQRRNAFLTLEQPWAQGTDATGRALGLRTSSVRGSLGMDGELVRQAATYNISFEGARTTSEPASFASADATTLARAGLAADSVARLRTVAAALGLPAGATGPRTRESFTWLARFDDTRDSLDSRALVTYASLSRSTALGVGPTTAPSATGTREEQAYGVQLRTSDYFGEGRRTLNRVRLAVGANLQRVDPGVALPGASVLVTSAASDASGVTGVQLGGASGLAVNDRRWTAEASDELLWTAGGRRHLFKAYGWARADGLLQSGTPNALGTFSFPTIGALAANQPASFTRTLAQPERRGGAWNAALAVAHQWAPSRTFTLLYGVRAEFDGAMAGPAENAALTSALGVGTGVPDLKWNLSPRVGFTWVLSKEKDNGNGMSSSPAGAFFRTMTGVLRGGVGLFRDLRKADPLADASGATGLGGSTQQLACIGGAAPAPTWGTFLANPATVPTSCLGGGGVLVDSAPPATLLDRAFDAPRSWRATLDWTQNIGWLLLKVSALGSYDLSQPGTVDANFAGVPRFTLAGEGGRPVFVPAGNIDAASGALSLAGTRRSAAYGRVGVRTSDLEGYGGQLTVLLAPDVFKFRRVPGNPYLSVAYTLQGAQRQYRGFDGAGFGDPRLVEWAPAATDARHVVVLQAATYGSAFGALSFFLRAQSGLPFTPLVGGDVNGDGRGGDRAFVPDPATTADTALKRQVSALLANGSETARACLTPFLGRVAERGGCRAPWTATLNAQWQLPLPEKMQRRWSVRLYAENLLGAVDQLAHGSSGLRGWGGPMNVDPVLLVPRGFDAAAQRFRYDVNPRFAETRPANTLDRLPFRLTLDVSLRFHVDFDLQTLRLALEPVKRDGRFERRGEDSILAFYLRRTSSIHKAMLTEADSLFLSREQVGAFQRADSAYSARVRAVFRPLARYLVSLPDGTPTAATLDSVSAADKAYWKVFWEQPEVADSIVNAAQRDLMPLLTGMLQVGKKEREQSQWMFGSPVTVADKPKPVVK